jgi:hypothetical protein
MVHIHLWLFALCVLGVMILAWHSLRISHQRQLESLRSEHGSAVSALHAEIEQMTSRLHRLHHDLEAKSGGVPRSEAETRRIGSPAVSAREALERELDIAASAWNDSNANGFADTEILPHKDEARGLLLQ